MKPNFTLLQLSFLKMHVWQDTVMILYYLGKLLQPFFLPLHPIQLFHYYLIRFALLQCL